MITWGIVSCATMAVRGPVGFYVLRILLGVAEAGFFPGIILYLTFWFPDRQRARVIALFMTAIALSGTLGNPLSGAIMEYLDGTMGLSGWQWLFLLEGLPSVALGLIVLVYLPDGPKQARWLTTEESDGLLARLSQEATQPRERHISDLLGAVKDRRTWLLIAIYFTVAVGSNAAGSYFPRLIKEGFSGESKFHIGLLSALPHVCAVVGMTVLGRHSDQTGERRGHVALAAFLAATGWVLSAIASSTWLGLAGLCLAQMGMMSMLPTFWALSTSFLRGTAAAGGIALINSVANIGGLLGPLLFGWFGHFAMAGGLFVGGALALCVRSSAQARES
jgi:ACS family tartrate transporter-like MFS transporter